MKRTHTWDLVDKRVLGFTGFFAIIFIVWSALRPENAAKTFNAILSFLTVDFGWLYLVVVTIFVAVLIFLAVSKYGNVRLGKDDERPEYSTASWVFMLFAAGMGIGLVFWGVAEPMSFYIQPPVGESGSNAAGVLAVGHAFMHWGIHPWACFAVVGLPLAYFTFRKDRPALISSCLEPIFGVRSTSATFGRVINVVTLCVCILGIATSLGLGAAQINAGLFYAFDVPVNNKMFIMIVVITMCCFIASSVSGIERGIKVLSDTNIAIAAVLVVFVLIVGPTVFICNMAVQGFGTYLQNIIPWSFWADPFNDTNGWVSAWTVFYWGWWISWAPFVGSFIARISRGRTIREYIVASLFVPSLLCMVYMAVFGGSAIGLTADGVTNIAGAIEENVAYAMFALLQNFPFARFFSVVAVFLICIFFVTSADSTTFVCAMMSCRGIQNPPALVKVFWGIIMAATAIVLQLVGGLTALQTACIAAAFPFMFICILMIIAFFRELMKEKVVIAVIPPEEDGVTLPDESVSGQAPNMV